MADDDWENKDFEKVELPKPPVVRSKTDKWEGEDEEEAVKDNWDDEDEQKPAGAAPKAVQVKKKKLLDKIAEKERKEEEERLAKLRANMTPEERAAEKLRQQKLQEEAELQMVKSTFGSNEIDLADPTTKDDFDALRKKLVADLRKFEKRATFEDFLEDFIQDLCLSLTSKRLRKVKTNVEALYHEKTKVEKASTGGGAKGKAGKPKAKLHVEADPTAVDIGAYEADDFDDFM